MNSYIYLSIKGDIIVFIRHNRKRLLRTSNLSCFDNMGPSFKPFNWAIISDSGILFKHFPGHLEGIKFHQSQIFLLLVPSTSLFTLTYSNQFSYTVKKALSMHIIWNAKKIKYEKTWFLPYGCIISEYEKL